ncbi:hypothetical protein [Verrucosispora sioxanthis]|nr:hypothetical protein [Verrucosispora sioxanthis]
MTNQVTQQAVNPATTRVGSIGSPRGAGAKAASSEPTSSPP